MCRFIYYHGEPLSLSKLIIEPKNSLVHQSVHSRERREPLNGDGFGVGWYSSRGGEQPGLFRSMMPAWNNINLANLAKVVDSHCILAHVRASTQLGSVCEENCHPFVSSQLAFMHNGQVASFPQVRRTLLESLSDKAFDVIRGRTDSEHLFAVFLDQLKVPADSASAEELGAALVETFRIILELSKNLGTGSDQSYLNVAITNGTNAAISRFTTEANYDGESLYWIQGHRYVCENGMCRMKSQQDGISSVVVSSERLDENPSWTEVSRNHMLLVSAESSVVHMPIEI